MFDRVFVDTSTYSSSADDQLISCVRFLAEDLMAYPVVTSDTFEAESATTDDEDEGVPGIWYDDGSPDRRGLLPYLVPFTSFSDYVFLSKEPEWNSIFMAHRGLDAETAMLLLAAMGIETCVPRAVTYGVSSDDLRSLQQNLGEERSRYLHAISAMANESFERIKTCYDADLLRWARNEAVFKIQPESERLERAFKKHASKTLRAILAEFAREGPIVLGKSLIEPLKTPEYVVERILPIFSSRLTKVRFAAESPLGTYLLRLKQSLPSS